MNFVKFSSTFLNQMLNRIFGSSYIGGSSVNCSLKVYKGTPPTPAEFLEMTSAQRSARDSDVLFSISYAYLFDKVVAAEGTTSLKQSPYVTATQSGVASWFILATDATNFMGVMGNVTNISGGGDLRLSSTNIIEGLPYRVQPITAYLPSHYDM